MAFIIIWLWHALDMTWLIMTCVISFCKGFLASVANWMESHQLMQYLLDCTLKSFFTSHIFLQVFWIFILNSNSFHHRLPFSFSRQPENESYMPNRRCFSVNIIEFEQMVKVSLFLTLIHFMPLVSLMPPENSKPPVSWCFQEYRKRPVL